MKLKLLGVIAGMALLGVPQASAASITYDITPLTIGSLSLTGGTITTDGTLGTLASFDITAWSITFTGGSPTPDTITGTSPYFSFTSSESVLSATPTELDFNFNPPPFPPVANLEFSNDGVSGVVYAPPPELYVSLDVGSLFQDFPPPTAFTYELAAVPSTPLPAALPLFAGGLGMMGLLGWRRRRKNAAVIAI